MRKVLFAAVASSIVLAIASASALAHGHHHRRHHDAHRTHGRVRDEHFGSRTDTNMSPSSTMQNAGTVASFSNGVLTLMLNDGSMVSGQVTNSTEIKCEAAEQEMEHSRHADGDHGGGSNGGGDDNGRGDDHGDDNDQGNDGQGAPMCSTGSLVPGATVRDAELAISGTGAIWSEVELAEPGH